MHWWLVFLLTAALAGCIPQSSADPTPTGAPEQAAAPPISTATPSSTPLIAPLPTATASPTPPPQGTATATSTPTAAEGTPTEMPPASTPPAADHYWLQRPIPSEYQDYADRTYSYGLTSGGRLRPHTAIDLPNPVGTPVLAAGNATVFYAGPDHDVVFGPQPDFYGNVIVLQMTDFTYNGQPVYTLYGHLSEILVVAGQQVASGEEIGKVGGTGVANGGPHLHFEVRVGNPMDYFTSTRNPDLWIKPYYGYGTLAGRVVDSSGALLPNVSLIIRSDGGSVRYTATYAGSENIPDEAWGENFTYGDLPEGWYEVSAQSARGRIYRARVYVHAGQTAWVEFVFE